MRVCAIVDSKIETPTIKTLRFEDDIPAVAGQFVMVWIPGVDEVPMSLSHLGERKGITVARVGPATSRLHDLGVGEKVGIRGPYGRGFELGASNSILAVGGGCGSAPIVAVIEAGLCQGKRIVYAVGARTGAELVFKERAIGLGVEVDISTDDGSIGYHGMVTERVARLLSERPFDLVVACGPEKMLEKMVDICGAAGIPIQVSLERYMKCGIGICDSCSMDGLQVCRDGPVFGGDVLARLKEFGSTRRDACGRRIPI